MPTLRIRALALLVLLAAALLCTAPGCSRAASHRALEGTWSSGMQPTEWGDMNIHFEFTRDKVTRWVETPDQPGEKVWRESAPYRVAAGLIESTLFDGGSIEYELHAGTLDLTLEAEQHRFTRK